MRGLSEQDAQCAGTRIPELEECETNPRPLMMSGSFDRNKRVSSQEPLIMSGLASFGSVAIQRNGNPNPAEQTIAVIK